ncbi:MAG: hypothetical protein ACRD9R_22685 [Pyrinomonadaceae bacterium]
MPVNNDTPQGELRRAIGETLAAHGADALGGRPTEEVATEWIAAGFDDAEEVADWLAARCFRAEVAARLEAAGLTPEQARLRTRDGRRNYEDTVAYKLGQDDLSVEEARRIVTNEFWNS